MIRPRSRYFVALRMSFAAIAVFLASVSPMSHGVTEIEVTTIDDEGPGSLRQALELAQEGQGPYLIHFGDREGLFATPQTIHLSDPLPKITGEVLIDGFIRRHLWTAYGATVSGGGEHRIFEVGHDATLHLTGITITNGYAPTGGGILNRGRLVVEGVSLLENRAEDAGGAIANAGGTAYIINSTLANSGADRGGAVANLGGKLTVTHGTLYRNQAESGPAIFSTAELALANSILWGIDGQGAQCVNTGPLIHSIANLFINDSEGCGTPLLEVDPGIGRFGYYNGPTPVFIIEGDSPVLNLADTRAAVDHEGNPLQWDQRGNGDPRFAGGYADIGAFERQSHLPTEYRVDTVEDTGLRGCTVTGPGNCPLRSAIELALAGRKPAPIRFDPLVFSEPQTLRLDSLPSDVDRRQLEFDGAGAAPVTIQVVGPRQDWIEKNGVSIEFEGYEGMSARGAHYE